MTTPVCQALLLSSLGGAVLGTLMFTLSVFLILLILVQRGKGGGLTGALGGPGGQSAFGSKAGDTFTVITAVSAIVWGLVCAIAMYTLGVPPLNADDADFSVDEPPAITAPAGEGAASGSSGLSGLSDALTTPPADTSAAAEADAAVAPENTDETAPTVGTPSLELTPAETTPAETTPE